MIRPIKVEVVYHDPKIYVFREILTEREMKRLKELGEPVVSAYVYIQCLLIIPYSPLFSRH